MVKFSGEQTSRQGEIPEISSAGVRKILLREADVPDSTPGHGRRRRRSETADFVVDCRPGLLFYEGARGLESGLEDLNVALDLWLLLQQ